MLRILITNDDGVMAEGLRTLVNVAKDFGEVRVVAPDRERSACGHAMTMRDPLRCHVVSHDFGSNVEMYAVNGLPVDCVNVGLTLCWPDGCDVILSGINNGPNMGFDVTYSGTVAGAMEGCINGIKSFSLSMAVFATGAPYHYETGAAWLRENWEHLMSIDQPERTFLNINVPAIAWPEIRGTKWVALGKRVYEDRVEHRTDPWGRDYYWQGGVVVVDAREENTDVWATSNGFASITPLTLDWTQYEALRNMEKSWNER